MSSAITSGFADPVFDSQKAFRRLLDALANPGRIECFDVDLSPPEGLNRATAVTLLTMTDFETSVWFSETVAQTAGPWLRFHAGAKLATETGRAAFALLTRSDGEPALADFSAGDDLYPDRSTTIIVQCTALEGGKPVRLTGPGIKDHSMVSPTGLPDGFWPALAASNARYPRGVDVILTCEGRLIGLPRSLTIILDPEIVEEHA